MGIVTRNENAWDVIELKKAMEKQDIKPCCFNLTEVVARISHMPKASIDNIDILNDLSALIIRPIGRGSLEEIIYRMDFLRHIERQGMLIVNSPSSIERSVDKYRALSLLEEQGLPVPRTVVTENLDEALKSFQALGEDVVLKPLFGSKGIGSTRISDPEIATRVFKAVTFHHGVLYLQEFIPHGNSDIRAFTLGDQVLACMRRIASTWKTNISKGAEPAKLQLGEEKEHLAVNAANAIGCEIAGIDIIEGPEGPIVIELNSQPGWKGLQSITPFTIADRIIQHICSKLGV